MRWTNEASHSRCRAARASWRRAASRDGRGPIGRESSTRASNERLGIAESEIISEYGMTELTSQYYAATPARAYVAPPWLRVARRRTRTDHACERNDRCAAARRPRESVLLPCYPNRRSRGANERRFRTARPRRRRRRLADARSMPKNCRSNRWPSNAT